MQETGSGDYLKVLGRISNCLRLRIDASKLVISFPKVILFLQQREPGLLSQLGMEAGDDLVRLIQHAFSDFLGHLGLKHVDEPQGVMYFAEPCSCSGHVMRVIQEC